MTIKQKALLMTAGIFLFHCSVQAQNRVKPEAFLVDIAPCMAIEAPPQRYACYDELAASSGSSSINMTSNDALPVEQNVIQDSIEQIEESLPIAGLQEQEQEQASSMNDFGFAKEAFFPSAEEIEREDIFVDNGSTITQLEDGTQELQDRVVDLSKDRRNYWEITLENGQVWKQTADKRFNLREGALVKISPTRWGDSYRLKMEGRAGFLQVRRLR